MRRSFLQNSFKTQEYLKTLPKIYLIACWAHYGIKEFPLHSWKQDGAEMIPMVYDYDDFNGTQDLYILRDIRNTTSGGKVMWTMHKEIAENIVAALNKQHEVN